MRLLAALLLLTVLARPLFAGAWMRDEGTGFFSFSVSATRDTASPGGATGFTQTMFAEYGLRPRLTFGANAWRDKRRGSGLCLLPPPALKSKAAAQTCR